MGLSGVALQPRLRFDSARAEHLGSITGTVTDPDAAVIPGADVEVTNQGTGTGRRTTTSAPTQVGIISGQTRPLLGEPESARDRLHASTEFLIGSATRRAALPTHLQQSGQFTPTETLRSLRACEQPSGNGRYPHRHIVRQAKMSSAIVSVVLVCRLVGSDAGVVARRIMLGLYPGFAPSCPVRIFRDSAPTSATSHAACGFPALRAPAHFIARVMRPTRL